MILHYNFNLICLAIFYLLNGSTVHLFKAQPIQKDESKIFNYSDKNNMSNQTVFSDPPKNDKLSGLSTVWRRLNSGSIKRFDKSHAMIDINKNSGRLTKYLSSLDNYNNLTIKLITTTARPTYNQIPRPMLFDEDFESVTGKKESYQALPTTAI